MNCAGRHVLVTAAGSGIGAQIARTLLSYGARVHICDRDRGVLDAFCKETPNATASLADVSLEADAERLVAEASAAMGGLDALVNNAGIAGPTAPIEDISLAEWRATYDVNVQGAFLCSRASVPRFKAAGGGSIVNMASVAGRLGYPLRAAYASSKWALIGLTKTLAMELGPSDIRVNAILPGMVTGPRLDNVVAARAHAEGRTEDEVRAGFLSNVSLRRAITPIEVAGLVAYLLSPLGRSLSGQAISLDGNVEIAR